MTNEEAIRIIKIVLAIAEDFEITVQGEEFTEEKCKEAVDIVTKALEQQPCKDCVSREEVEKITWEEPSYTDALNVLTGVREKVRALPSVHPQPKRGKWISHREHCKNLGVMPSGLGAYEWCSNCDCGIDVKEFHRNYYNFCPNCGADMREVQDDD